MTTVPWVPFEARVKPEVYALCRALHQIKCECDDRLMECEPERHEDDACALLAWLDEYGFVVRREDRG